MAARRTACRREDHRGSACPPDRDPKSSIPFIHRAPAGHPDAGILVLNAGDELQAYQDLVKVHAGSKTVDISARLRYATRP